MVKREASKRIFVALAPPDDVRARLARVAKSYLAPDEQAPEGMRLLEADDLHVTLLFMGVCDEALIGRFTSILAEELRGLNAPELHLDGTGAFPSRAAPRVLWAGLEEDGESVARLAALHNRVRQAAYSVGWRGREHARALVPHVTLARLQGNPEVHPTFYAQDLALRWFAGDVHVMESVQAGAGARYRTLASVPLVVRPG